MMSRAREIEEPVYTGEPDREHEALMYELENLEDDQRELQPAPTRKPRWWTRRLRKGHNTPKWHTRPTARTRALTGRLSHLVVLIALLIVVSIPFCGLFYPSYSYPPERYVQLRDRVLRNETANTGNEKIFLAASLYDHEGELLSGQWGQAVLELVHMLGKDNVFVSIYENDPDEKAQAALDTFRQRLPCESQLTSEHLNLNDFPHVATPDGSERVKRISFLADVRNRALRPLEDKSTSAYRTRFDKLLYLNDVMFDPIDAANLIFSTNVNDANGRTEYRAACAVDFINAFKFYDTYATRDIEGYELGIPFYPWFAADTQSRRDVLVQKDAVQVKSCWGGMVSFEAKWFQPNLESTVSIASVGHTDIEAMDNHNSTGSDVSDNSSLRFRASSDTYWDGSECCFIHADLSAQDPTSLAQGDTGVYMNPYIRVAYHENVLPWLWFTRRFERLYTPVHAILNWIISRPPFNPRRLQTPGEEVTDRVWTWDEESQAKLRERKKDDLHGSFKEVQRTALPGGFCGLRKLSYINEHPKSGEKHYVMISAPAID